MKCAVLVPDWSLGPSGGRQGLRRISMTLRKYGVDAVSVGLDEGFGDVVVNPASAPAGPDTAFIVPEGIAGSNAADYWMHFIEDVPHGPVIMYVQNYSFCDPHADWTTHYWSLGPAHRDLVRDKMEIPEEMPIEELLLPVDHAVWDRSSMHPERMPGSVLYSTARNVTVLDAVARHILPRTVFRVAGASQEQLRTMMAMADIFLLASDAEGQSCIMNEAMAMECAVVTWPSGGLTDIVAHEKTALVVRQNDVVGLSDCVKRLQNDPQTARTMGKNARKHTEKLLGVQAFETRLMELWSKIERSYDQGALPVA